METHRVCLVALLLTAVAINGSPTVSPALRTEAPHDVHVPREPRVEHPHPPQPPHVAALDKPVHAGMPRDTDLGSISCTDDANCTSSAMGPESICHGSICACKTGSTQSTSTLKCLHESTLGSGCEEDWQCTKPLGPAVSCQKHICTCTSDAAMVNGKCWKQKLLADQCTFAEECLRGRDTECTDQRCACKSGLTANPSNTKCLPTATKYEDPCEEDIQCTEPFGEGGACTNAKCVCKEGYHLKNHVCMKNLIVGESCGAGLKGDCFLFKDQGINHVSCVDGICKCKDDRTPSGDNQMCLSQGQIDPGKGGAESVQPLMITFLTIFFARFLLS